MCAELEMWLQERDHKDKFVSSQIKKRKRNYETNFWIVVLIALMKREESLTHCKCHLFLDYFFKQTTHYFNK